MAQSSIEWTEMTWNPRRVARKFLKDANSVTQRLCRKDLKPWEL